MLLTITTTHRPTTDLGFLLHKHPDRFQSFDLSFGHAHVFYPESSEDRITAALMLDVDPIGMVRGKNADQGFSLGPFASTSTPNGSFGSGKLQCIFDYERSLLSVAPDSVAQNFWLVGHSQDKPDVACPPLKQLGTEFYAHSPCLSIG